MVTRRNFLAGAAQATLSGGMLAAAQSATAGTRGERSTFHGPLKSYRIPRTDLTVSRLAFGCAMLGWDSDAADFVERSIPLIETAYDQGIRFFDLADVYGHGKAEIALGEVLKRRPGMRRSIVIQSKCGDRFSDGQGTSSIDNSREHILSSVEGSLKRLGIDHLDILLLHWPDSLVEPEEVAQAFARLKRSGKVRYFGVSNHSPYQIENLKHAVREPLMTNQIQLGLGHWFAEDVNTVEYCRAHDIQLQAYSPLRAFTGRRTPVNLLKPADDAPPEVKHAAQLLGEVAQRHGVTPAAVMLSWLLRHPAKIIPIIGAIKREHIIENCAADGVELDREEWYQLLNAAVALRTLE